MSQSYSGLSRIHEEDISEISSFSNISSKPEYEENIGQYASTTELKHDSQTHTSMHSRTFTIDTNNSSYKCFKEIILSSSSVFLNPLYYFPELEDPGIRNALEIEDQRPLIDDGCQLYKNMCKEMEIVPIRRVCESLALEELNLKYYVPFEKQMKVICKVLESNRIIRILNLENNWLSVKSCSYLASVLEVNASLQVLKMKKCRIGAEGMAAIAEGLKLSYIQELDLSFNSLGDEGLKVGKVAFSDNVTHLNLSHNGLSEEAVYYLYDILKENSHLLDLNLSWNSFNNPKCTGKLCESLSENTSLQRLNLAWNGISSEKTVTPFIKYLSSNESLKFLDLSNNSIGGSSMGILMKGISRSNSLEHVKIGNNIFPPQRAFFCAQILSKPRKNPLKIIDMENMVVQRKFLDLLERIKNQGKEVIHGTVLADYVIYGPYIPKVLLGRCKYLSMKPKKIKKRVNFGHFILSLPREPITVDDFQAILQAKKLKKLLDKNLITAVQDQYILSKTGKIDCPKLVNDYMLLYPDTLPEPPKRKKKLLNAKKLRKRNKKVKEPSAAVIDDVAKFNDQELQENQPSRENDQFENNGRKHSLYQEGKILQSWNENAMPSKGVEDTTGVEETGGILSLPILDKQLPESFVGKQESKETVLNNQEIPSLNASGVFIMESETVDKS